MINLHSHIFKHVKIRIILLIIFFLISLYIFYLVLSSGISFNDFGNIEKIKLLYEKLNFKVQSNFFHVFLYICIYILFIFFLGFPLIFTILTIIIFEPILSIIINVLSITLGSFFFYLLLQKNIKLVLKKKIIVRFKKYQNIINKNEFFGIFLFRFFAGSVPFVIQNLILYCFNVSFKNFIFGTFLALTISCTILTFFGKSLLTIIFY
jgi:uncharacterized membrane protein YdjX (TVP38/TMEM64 family)